MFKTIVNPETGRKVKVNGKIGQKVLNNYKKQYGGAKYSITNYYNYYYDREMADLQHRQHEPQESTPEAELRARERLGAAVLNNKSAEAGRDQAAAEAAAYELRVAYTNYNNKLTHFKKAKWFNESHKNPNIDDYAHEKLVDEYFGCDNVTNLPADECCDTDKKLRRKGRRERELALGRAGDSTWCKVGIAHSWAKPLDKLSGFSKLRQKLDYRESKSKIKRLKREREKQSEAEQKQYRAEDVAFTKSPAGQRMLEQRQQATRATDSFYTYDAKQIAREGKDKVIAAQGPGPSGYGFVQSAYGGGGGGGGKKKSSKRKSKRNNSNKNRNNKKK